ncbi:hypothetical protein BpHYR1_044422 [Brachionus plicatilis]|uniref:Uncharacterized protein n=1 Tax=Brachionus plicatilis TaxID=10195 RepID=A0A3M7QE92_BRAPC|nr:hypothetical protein BpHYR1_044422 [Brachionus plicatilis]
MKSKFLDKVATFKQVIPPKSFTLRIKYFLRISQANKDSKLLCLVFKVVKIIAKFDVIIFELLYNDYYISSSKKYQRHFKLTQQHIKNEHFMIRKD